MYISEDGTPIAPAVDLQRRLDESECGAADIKGLRLSAQHRDKLRSPCV